MSEEKKILEKLDADDLRKILLEVLSTRTTNESTSHVELVKNSKGVNVGVKVYDNNIEEASKKAKKEFDELDKKYNKEG